MAKKIRKRRANYFNIGGDFKKGKLNGAISAAGSMAGQGISGEFSTGAGNAIQGLGNIASAIPGPWGAIAGAGLNIVGGLVNRAFGSQINEQAVQEAKAANSQQSNMQFSASNTADLLGQSDFGMLGHINQSDIGKDGWFSDKAKKLTAELNRQREIANQQAIANFGAAAENLDTQNDLDALSHYAAYGGPLTMRYTGTMSPFGNTFSEGGKIHIKPENRGKFTRLKERTGKSATWFKEHGTPAQRKMATFALNARKWKHAFGGNLLTNGTEWDNGLTIIGNGGTHEENPMEGVQMGMDAQGIPNLVEEGEVIFNDYVFSDRMKVPKDARKPLGLGKNKDMTFADAAKKLSKESEERPNDPISKNGLNASLGLLTSIQENERMREQRNNTKYASGGILGKKYRGPGEYPNVLDIPDNTAPYAYWGNQGRNRVTNPRIAEGWDSFTWNNQPLYDTESDRYNPLYTDIRFQNYVRQNYDQLSKDWWNESNAPDYYRAGNTSAPTIDQMLGNGITSTGLMYDKKYGEAHRFGQYALEQYMKSLNKTPQLDFTKPIAMSPTDIKPFDLSKTRRASAEEERKGYSTWLRYAPVVGAAVGLGQNIFSKPDYSSSDAILNAANEAGRYTPVGFNPLGDYLTYRPFDRNYYINKLNAQSGAIKRAIVNQSAGNRATALAGLLAADYNAQGKLGDLARQAEEYNLGQREIVATFNRDTNQFNSEMGLKAAMANQEAALEARSQRLSGVAQAMAIRDAIDDRRNASMSANLSNLFNSLGDIGRENYIRNMINSDKSLLYGTDRRGNQYYKGSKGGYLTVKGKRKGGKHA